MWHRVAPSLAESFTVVATDLRGYGDSSTVPTTADHAPYSKRAMARDQVTVMRQLGFDRFSVAGHDRGGRCAYRLALDHPDRVSKLAVLDIVPTGEMWRRVDMEFAMVDWHWFFLAQPYPFPETVIASNPQAFYFPGDRSRFHPDALAEYLRCTGDPADDPPDVRGLPGRGDVRPGARRGRPHPRTEDRLSSARALERTRRPVALVRRPGHLAMVGR
jgi:haloacetate dehalogenase